MGQTDLQPDSGDFRALEEAQRAGRASPGEGRRTGASWAIGSGFVLSRNRVARLLIRVGATPNTISLAGLVFTCAAAYCLARGAGQQVPYFARQPGPVGWWPVLAAVGMILAGACDMLDGAVARLGNMKSRAGGLLDSTLDRLGDMALYIGCFIHFAWQAPANWTYPLLAVVALCNGVLISYVKARAENLLPDCSVGYWLRGERFAAMLIGCLVGHVPAVLWQMAVSAAFTVSRRISFAYCSLQAADGGRPAPPRGPASAWYGRWQWWRHPRGSLGYDVVTGAHIAYIVAAPCWWPVLLAAGAWADPLRRWLEALG